jgi:hypothetical protein
MVVDNEQSTSLKEDVIKYLQDQPDDITIEDIMDYLFVKQQILNGQKDLRNGNYYTHEEAKEIMKILW